MTASFFAPQRNNSKIPAKRMLAPNLDDQEGLGKGLSRTVPQVRYAKTRSATAASPALRGYQGRGSGLGSKTGAFLPPTRLKSNDRSDLSQPDLLLAATNASGVYQGPNTGPQGRCRGAPARGMPPRVRMRSALQPYGSGLIG